MRLEHKSEKVISNLAFLKRQVKYFVFVIGLVLFSLGIGIMGYRFFGGLDWLDSFYMSSMILTGMGPVAEMTSDEAKWFSSFYALYSGIAFLSITAVFLAPVIHRIFHVLHVENSE